ncbi:MAG: tetraacyldisaccharide 4'-kinase [Oxalobacter sp.]|nr:tetraacyldisaccharide 4'-kinase [Oxalobacter sp.]
MSGKASREHFWMRVWLGRGLLAILLYPLSLLFRGITAFRRFAYQIGFFKSTKLPVPVIVVGNIFVGGTGKTPIVIWLTQILRKAGFTPGIISRGYGTSNSQPRSVDPGLSQASEVGDEPLLIAMRTQCPLTVCRKRVAAAQHLLAEHPEIDIIISDDGLQHYALARDIEILLFDGRGAGNQWMLPAGPLREPPSRRGDFTIINGHNYPAPNNPIYTDNMFLMQLKTDTAEQLANRRNVQPLSQIKGKITAAAGIGNPGRFFASLKNQHLSFEEMPLPDHYSFSENPFRNTSSGTILITEKDAVKCAQRPELIADERIWVVPASVEIDNHLLESKIVEKCHEYKTA